MDKTALKSNTQVGSTFNKLKSAACNKKSWPSAHLQRQADKF